MKTARYNRSEVISFAEVPEQYAKEYDLNDDDLFVVFENEDGSFEYLPLSSFTRCESPIWNGIFGMTAFSAYYVKLNRSCDEALVAYRYC